MSEDVEDCGKDPELELKGMCRELRLLKEKAQRQMLWAASSSLLLLMRTTLCRVLQGEKEQGFNCFAGLMAFQCVAERTRSC